jgi:ATP:ADP antiporter, AAA family
MALPIDLRPGEGRPVLLLLAGSALLGAFSVFLSSVAAAIFLDTFGTGALPFLYVGSAILVASAGVGYATLESRIAVRRLLPGTLAFLLIAALLLRLALALQGHTWPVVLLAGFGELAASFVPLTFWAMAGRLFDVRQAKRLFGPVGAGEVAATAAGGFTAPLIVGLIGTINLLWLCALALVGLLAVFLLVIRSFPASFAEEQQTAEQRRFKLATRSRPKLTDRYVVLILLFAVFATLTYYFVSTAFLVQARNEFPSQDALAGFLGVFTGVLSVVGFAGRGAVAGRVMERFGLRTSLLLSPIAVAVTAALVIATGILPALGISTIGVVAAASLVFYANSLNRLCMETTWDSIYKPAFLILYQPLQARSRLWLQTVVEGIAAPLAQGLTGICLLLYRIFLGFDPVGLSIASLGIASVWLIVGTFTGHRYMYELLAAVRNRSQGVSSDTADPDPAMLHTVEERLQSEKPGEVVYCLTVLDDANYTGIEQILVSLARHTASTVREEALHRIARRRIVSAARIVTDILENDPEMRVRAAALRTISVLDPVVAEAHLNAALESGEREMRLTGLVGMLHATGHMEADGRERVRELAYSRSEEDRVLAAQVVTDANAGDLHIIVGHLLRDSSQPVVRAALAAAAKVNHPELWQRVVQRLVVPETARAAATALIEAGPTAMPFLVAAFVAPQTERALRLNVIRLCGRIKDQEALDLLLRALEQHDAEARRLALRALYVYEYRATGPLAHQIPQLVGLEVAAGSWMAASQLDLQKMGNALPAIAANTCEVELEFARERALLWLSLIYDANAIMRCASLLSGGNAERRAYAMEILDNLLPHAIKTMLFPLLDDLTPEARLNALRKQFPQPRMKPEERLQHLLSQ